MFNRKNPKEKALDAVAARDSLKQKMIEGGPNTMIEITPEELFIVMSPEMENIIGEVEQIRAKQAANVNTAGGVVGKHPMDGLSREPDHAEHLKQQDTQAAGECPVYPGPEDVTFESVCKPVADYLKQHCCPHVKIVIDSTGAEMFSGLQGVTFNENREYDPEVTALNIRKGDMLTVREWTSHKDRSYVGDLLEVVEVAYPHVFLKHHNRYNPSRIEKLQLSFNDVVFTRVSQDFLNGFEWLSDKDAK